MKLCMVFILLLFEVPKDEARTKKCFNNISGFCRKRCQMGEISETGCLGGKLCCVKEGENQRYQDAHKPALPSKDESSGPQDYVVLPTITLLTTQP
ncbi:beta-defensin 128 [Ochotona curzoniae]|uniref:beta-defensin 128 n=1 Tax=Ochotona curzoniae TaxID=130825 RepID=UPI001B34BA25|nr:beta-defensin 128 [Ochotona curzoniae]